MSMIYIVFYSGVTDDSPRVATNTIQATGDKAKAETYAAWLMTNYAPYEWRRTGDGEWVDNHGDIVSILQQPDTEPLKLAF